MPDNANNIRLYTYIDRTYTMYLAKNNTLLKRTYVAYVSMATKYPIIKIVICANYENIGHKLLGPLKEGGGGVWCYVLCTKFTCLLCAM